MVKIQGDFRMVDYEGGKGKITRGVGVNLNFFWVEIEIGKKLVGMELT